MTAMLNRKNIRRAARCLALLAGAAPGLIGCQQFQPQKPNPYANVRLGGQAVPMASTPAIDPTKIELRDDIVQVVQFWPQSPWIKDGATGRVIGFRATVYFQSSETERGAFVPGPIYALLSQVKSDSRGRVQRIPLHQWELDESQAMSFRVRKEAVMGYAYSFILKWPEEIDVSGRQVELVFGYQRQDGAIVRGQPIVRRVDLPPVGTPRPGPALASPTRSAPRVARPLASPEPDDAPPAATRRLEMGRP
ncbi:MAG: hypothetical protein AB7Q17_11160 [Phycisphaerae bacterium]